MEIGFGRAAVAQPRCRNVIFTFDSGRHCPANGMRVLRAKVAGDRKYVRVFVVIKNWKLAPFTHVARIRKALAHHVDKFCASV